MLYVFRKNGGLRPVHVLLSRFYPDFIQSLSRVDPDFIWVLSSFYPDFILFSKTNFIQISSNQDKSG